MYDFEDVNAILAEMRDDGMIEPIDEDSCHPLEWAEVTGLVDEIFEEMYPESEMRPMLDENGSLWYVG